MAPKGVYSIIELIHGFVRSLVLIACALGAFHPAHGHFQHYRIESAYIKANRNRCMNLNEGLGVITIYGKGKEGKRKFT